MDACRGGLSLLCWLRLGASSCRLPPAEPGWQAYSDHTRREYGRLVIPDKISGKRRRICCARVRRVIVHHVVVSEAKTVPAIPSFT